MSTETTPPRRRSSTRLRFTKDETIPLSLIVKHSHIPHMKTPLGLFTQTSIRKGTIVAQLEDPVPVKSYAAVEAQGFPHDSIIDTRLWGLLWDRAFERHKPLWYHMNHKPATSANIEMIHGKRSVLFKAREHIAAGSELCYNYGVVPKSWNKHS